MKPSLIIVGLGNPGATYGRTRHNAGFMATDTLSGAFGVGEWAEKQKFLSIVQEARVVTVPIFLVKPQTYMNRSGEAVRKLVDFYKIDPSQQLLVICDDIDIPLGELRLRLSGGPGTHNGLKSLVATLGVGFPRLRIGLGAPKQEGTDLAAWVLSVPPEDERRLIQETIASIPDRVQEYILHGTNKE